MAKNLRAKLPSSDELFIYDKNETATERFSQEVQGATVASSPRDVAERSVRQEHLSALQYTRPCMMNFVLSMI